MSRAETAWTVGAPQHRMPRRLFLALSLASLLLCCACGPAYAGGDLPVSSVRLFEAGKTKVPKEAGDSGQTRAVNSFNSPFLAAGSGVMVALAEARCTESVDIVARYIDTDGENWADNAVAKGGENWGTQLALKKTGAMHYNLSVPTAVVRDNKIYLLALNEGSVESEYDLKLVVGAISSEGRKKTIQWGTNEPPTSELNQGVKSKLSGVYSSYGHSAFVTRSGTIVFSVNARNKADAPGFAIMQLKNGTNSWEVSFVENSQFCSFISFIEWEGKLISLFSGCRDSNGHVKEYDEASKEWKEFNGTLLRMWDGKKELRNFISVTVENKNVLLFIGISSSGETLLDEQWSIHLWMTDGNRVYDAGAIDVQKTVLTSGSLLHTKGELFFVHHQQNENSGTVVFTRLNQQLVNIRSVLETWDRNDARFLGQCGESTPRDASPGNRCLIPMPTDGLVGFLSNGGNTTHWQDAYLFMDAMVKGGTRMGDGFWFSGADSGAAWPVGRSGFGKRYDFESYGLTVVATVIIREVPKSDAPLLTVEIDGVEKHLGLWYNDKQWKLISSDKSEVLEIDWETQRAHSVALVLQNDTISAYINGRSLGDPLPISAPEEESFEIKNVYYEPEMEYFDWGSFFTAPRKKSFDIENVFIGGYGSGAVSSVMVTNVFLYNRVLSGTELETASKKIATAMLTVPTEEAAQAANSTEEAAQAANSTEEAAQAANSTEEAAQAPNSTEGTANPLNRAHEAASGLHSVGGTNLSLMGLGDSSVRVRMGANLLFLLALRVLALFF